MTTALILLVPAYLAGTFPTAVLVARAGGHDITAEGSGNPGASNVYRLMGLGPAVLVFLGDFAKGAVPALVGNAVWGHAGAFLLGIAAVLGHVYPLTRRLRGGRGVATGAGMAMALYPLVVSVLVVVFLVVAYVLHRASVASLVVTVSLPLGAWLTGEPGAEVLVLCAVALLVLVRHAANVRRLFRGEELRLDGADGGSEAA